MNDNSVNIKIEKTGSLPGVIPGKTIIRYRTDTEPLGQGAVGVVYSTENERYAVKVPYGIKGIREFENEYTLLTGITSQAVNTGLTSVVPEVAWGKLSDEPYRPALIMPRYTTYLSDYVRTTRLKATTAQERLDHALQAEKRVVKAFIDFCMTMVAMRANTNASCVDRKAMDFFIYDDGETADRTVVIDWNVLSDATEEFFQAEIQTSGRVIHEILIGRPGIPPIRPFADDQWQTPNTEKIGVVSIGLRMLIRAALEQPDMFRDDESGLPSHGKLGQHFEAWLNLLDAPLSSLRGGVIDYLNALPLALEDDQNASESDRSSKEINTDRIEAITADLKLRKGDENSLEIRNNLLQRLQADIEIGIERGSLRIIWLLENGNYLEADKTLKEMRDAVGRKAELTPYYWTDWQHWGRWQVIIEILLKSSDLVLTTTQAYELREQLISGVARLLQKPSAEDSNDLDLISSNIAKISSLLDDQSDASKEAVSAIKAELEKIDDEVKLLQLVKARPDISLLTWDTGDSELDQAVEKVTKEGHYLYLQEKDRSHGLVAEMTDTYHGEMQAVVRSILEEGNEYGARKSLHRALALAQNPVMQKWIKQELKSEIDYLKFLANFDVDPLKDLYDYDYSLIIAEAEKLEERFSNAGNSRQVERIFHINIKYVEAALNRLKTFNNEPSLTRLYLAKRDARILDKAKSRDATLEQFREIEVVYKRIIEYPYNATEDQKTIELLDELKRKNISMSDLIPPDATHKSWEIILDKMLSGWESLRQQIEASEDIEQLRGQINSALTTLRGEIDQTKSQQGSANFDPSLRGESSNRLVTELQRVKVDLEKLDDRVSRIGENESIQQIWSGLKSLKNQEETRRAVEQRAFERLLDPLGASETIDEIINDLTDLTHLLYRTSIEIFGPAQAEKFRSKVEKLKTRVGSFSDKYRKTNIDKLVVIENYFSELEDEVENRESENRKHFPSSSLPIPPKYQGSHVAITETSGRSTN